MPQKQGFGNLDFEQPILELEKRIEELEDFSRRTGVNLNGEIQRLREKSDEKKREIFSNLTAWQKVQLARHPNRPDVIDYINLIFEDLLELHGDKCFSDDKAIITGFCRIDNRKIMLIGHRKGRNTQERIRFNFGSAHPEGYRKALEKMKLAERFSTPVVTLVNTPGAYPGIGAEERGQAWAIAENLLHMSLLKIPIISIIIGEGGSGGALGICLADKLSIMENAYLSVISPEGCAAILWRDSSKAYFSAELLKLTPKDLLQLGVVDEIIPEPLGGANKDHKQAAAVLKAHLIKYLDELASLTSDELLNRRYEKYRKIGRFIEQELKKIS